MTLEQLRAFVAVAERAHMTRGAEALGRTQSAVSAAIRALEDQSGILLFNRVGRGIELTEAGRRFLPEARHVLERARIARAVLDQSSGTESGLVSIGASQTIANYWLPRRLAAFGEAYPGIRLEISIANTQVIEDSVVSGAVDIGLVEGPTTHDVLVRRVFGTDRPVLVVSAQSPMRPQTFGRADLQDLVWVVREEGSGTRHILNRLCAEMSVPFAALRIVLVLPSNEAVREAVAAGAGATIISEHVAAPLIEEGRLRAIPLDLPERDFAIVHHSERRLTPPQRVLVDFLEGS